MIDTPDGGAPPHPTLEPELAHDVAAVGRLAAVPKILRAVADTTGMRFAAVARVTDERWVACAVRDEIAFGLEPGGELPLESTICDEIRRHREPVIFGHASTDPCYRDHPTPKRYGFESYISIPIFRRHGEFFGTLCAIDPRPAKLDDPNIRRSLELYAELIATQLDQQEEIELGRRDLVAAGDLAKLREQFIAVLGHDLRSPLQSISAGTQLLRRAPLDEKWQRQLDRMERSCDRLVELTDDILDFARARLGDGISLNREDDAPLATELQHVVAEVGAANPARTITYEESITRPVRADRRRIAQLATNLVANAIKHGAEDRPVHVVARTTEVGFELCVHNEGPPIGEATRRNLFEPFSHVGRGGYASGLGLGLFIAAQIARAHGGSISFTSDEASGTTFRFVLPSD